MGKLENWGALKEDRLKCFNNKKIAIMKEFGNTVMDLRKFKKTVRKVYKDRTGIKLNKYNEEYVKDISDVQIKDAIVFWHEYMLEILGFEVSIRMVTDIEMDRYSSLRPCVLIQRKGMNEGYE